MWLKSIRLDNQYFSINILDNFCGGDSVQSVGKCKIDMWYIYVYYVDTTLYVLYIAYHICVFFVVVVAWNVEE